MKLGMNGPPMTPHGLIFSEDGAIPSNMLSIWLPALYEAILDAFLHEMGSGPWTLDLGPQRPKLIYCYRNEGFPLTGIFHPWAQWDRGLDALENSSAVVAAAAPWGGIDWLVGWLVGRLVGW